MTTLQLSELHKLPTAEKLRIVQDLWDDISEEKSMESLSVEHKKILDDRIEKLHSGNTTFKSWPEIQAKYKR